MEEMRGMGKGHRVSPPFSRARLSHHFHMFTSLEAFQILPRGFFMMASLVIIDEIIGQWQMIQHTAPPHPQEAEGWDHRFQPSDPPRAPRQPAPFLMHFPKVTSLTKQKTPFIALMTEEIPRVLGAVSQELWTKIYVRYILVV